MFACNKCKYYKHSYYENGIKYHECVKEYNTKYNPITGKKINGSSNYIIDVCMEKNKNCNCVDYEYEKSWFRRIINVGLLF